MLATLLAQDKSEIYPRPKLKSTWATGAEDLGEARTGLTKPAGEIATVAGKVRGIKDVEHLPDEG